MGSKRLKAFLAVGGWVVAAVSLWLNYKTYDQSSKLFTSQSARESVYDTELKTYDPNDFPSEIASQPLSVRHSFRVRHRNGAAIKNLTLEIDSPDAEIVNIELTAGELGTTVNQTKHHVILARTDFVPESEVSGYVETDRLAAVTMAVGAENAIDIGKADPITSDWSISLIWVIAILLSAVLVYGTVFLIFWRMWKLRNPGGGYLEAVSSSREDYWLFFCLLVLALLLSRIGLSVSEFFFVGLTYFCMTRYRLMSSALERLNAPNPIGAQDQPAQHGG